MEGFSYYETDLGLLEVGCTGGAVTHLDWVDAPAHPHAPAPLSDEAARQVRQYLAGERRVFDLPLAPAGTDFQRAVWRALADIPYGETRTYGQIAASVGRPGAARAVGAAAGRNPIAPVIPCHRCVGKGGALTGYAGGLWRKERLLALEAKNRE
ncbi:MAG: methylated-DNA--[Oscillospiraceae bacterium]|nr:methylated-DNA--[protein]-cysteine S-methyltransferase [Oscillospiraceae bacterium]